MASLEDQIRALMESNKQKADRIDQEPAVKIENPMDPNLTSSEVNDQGEKTDADKDGDAKQREKAAKEKADKERKDMTEDAQQNFDAALAASKVDATGDRHEDQFMATQGVQNEEDLDPSDADAMARFEQDKAKAEAEREGVVMPEVLGDLLGQEFTEDFKLKAQTIFEAAVKQKVSEWKEKMAKEHSEKMKEMEEAYIEKCNALEKEFQEKFDINTKQIEEKTREKIDGYLTYVAEEWTAKNELALEAGIKTELTESFINKLKDLCEEHYIDMPEAKVDLYSKTLQEKAELETSLSNVVTSMTALKEELNQIKRANIIEESLKDFSSLDASRFKSLVEDFEFEDSETFKKKVSIVKSSFFENKQSANVKEQLTEELTKSTKIVDQGSSTIEPIVENTRMSAYVSALRT